MNFLVTVRDDDSIFRKYTPDGSARASISTDPVPAARALFSNSVAPHIVAATLKALELLTGSTELRDKLEANTKYFRNALTERGLTIKPGVHPIVPIMIGDAAKSQKFAARMLEKGVYVIGFFYPVVPHGTARVRTQVSAAHSREDLEFAVDAFAKTNEELK